MIEQRIKCDRCLDTCGGLGDVSVSLDVVVEIRWKHNGHIKTSENPTLGTHFDHLCMKCMNALKSACAREVPF